jgi:hypothetical protein
MLNIAVFSIRSSPAKLSGKQSTVCLNNGYADQYIVYTLEFKMLLRVNIYPNGLPMQFPTHPQKKS